MPDGRFAGRTVMVFGAAGALGAGLAAAFAAEGAALIGVDRSTPATDRRLEGARYHAVDVLDNGALAALFDAAPPWAVVNTVGGFAPYAALTDLDPAVLTGQLELNLLTAALVTKHALRHMKAVGRGRLVHTASRAATVTRGQGFAYSVSKLGVLHLVAMAADEAAGIIAGTAEMPWKRFLAFTTLGAVLWVAVWAPVGYLAGDHIGVIYATATRYSLYLLIALLVLLAAWIARAVWRRKRSPAPRAPE